MARRYANKWSLTGCVDGAQHGVARERCLMETDAILTRKISL